MVQRERFQVYIQLYSQLCNNSSVPYLPGGRSDFQAEQLPKKTNIDELQNNTVYPPTARTSSVVVRVHNGDVTILLIPQTSELSTKRASYIKNGSRGQKPTMLILLVHTTSHSQP